MFFRIKETKPCVARALFGLKRYHLERNRLNTMPLFKNITLTGRPDTGDCQKLSLKMEM